MDCVVKSEIVNWINGRIFFQFIVLALVAAAYAAPQQNPQDVQLLRYDVNNAGLDSYSFA